MTERPRYVDLVAELDARGVRMAPREPDPPAPPGPAPLADQVQFAEIEPPAPELAVELEGREEKLPAIAGIPVAVAEAPDDNPAPERPAGEASQAGDLAGAPPLAGDVETVAVPARPDEHPREKPAPDCAAPVRTRGERAPRLPACAGCAHGLPQPASWIGWECLAACAPSCLPWLPDPRHFTPAAGEDVNRGTRGGGGASGRTAPGAGRPSPSGSPSPAAPRGGSAPPARRPGATRPRSHRSSPAPARADADAIGQTR